MEVKFKRVAEDSIPPMRMSSGAAGFDLTASSKHVSTKFITYDTGIAFQIPEGYVGLVFPRSSVYKKGLALSNSVGVIDSDYRGTVKLKFRRVAAGDYDVGDRIGQIVFMPILTELSEVGELEGTDRGEGGFGSTGQ